MPEENLFVKSDSWQRYIYKWPYFSLSASKHWRLTKNQHAYERCMPESLEDLSVDSRWPAFFPAPISYLTCSDGSKSALERVVGASIVNRFPYVLAVSLCLQEISSRHYARRVFTEILENSGCVALQFLPPGDEMDRVAHTIASSPESQTCQRITLSGLATHQALTNPSPVFDVAYMVYEARLVKPGKDLSGKPIYQAPWVDIGSHRIYFLEIEAIQLRRDIAEGKSQILWRSLPVWRPQYELANSPSVEASGLGFGDYYRKRYTPHYAFPSAGTTAFEADTVINEMAVKHLPPLPEDQVEVDNDRARWPCFFPASVGMITTWTEEGVPNMMPCGSTTTVSRRPLVIAPCVSYAAINVRYAPRATLDIIRKTGKLGCGIPFINDRIVAAIEYAGNVSIKQDLQKVAHAGLEVEQAQWSPIITNLPVHFDCKVVGEVRLGTHVMFLGEVRRIQVRTDVAMDNPLEWVPCANVVSLNDNRGARAKDK